jgi:hypothetical protein
VGAWATKLLLVELSRREVLALVERSAAPIRGVKANESKLRRAHPLKYTLADELQKAYI